MSIEQEIDNQLLLFPTVGHIGENSFCTAEIHGWFFRKDVRTKLGRTILGVLRRKMNISHPMDEPPEFLQRAFGFAVANHKGSKTNICVGDARVGLPRTKRNGHFKIKIKMDRSDVESQMLRTDHGTPILPFHVSTEFRKEPVYSTGRIHFLEPNGVSIISDIDDTIKDSNVKDKTELLINTFLRPYKSVESMPELFQSLASIGTTFHYVSATPWQLFPNVANFLLNGNYPEGSIHLRKFALKDTTVLNRLTPSHKGKRKTIERIISGSPQRSFYLIGDSGEKDPEIYGDVARKFLKQIKGIFIRNVSEDFPGAVRFKKAFANIPEEKLTIYENTADLKNSLQLLEPLNNDIL